MILLFGSVLLDDRLVDRKVQLITVGDVTRCSRVSYQNMHCGTSIMIALILYSICFALKICQPARRIMIIVTTRLNENQEASRALGLLKKKDVCICSNTLTLYLLLRTPEEEKSAGHARKKLRKTHCGRKRQFFSMRAHFGKKKKYIYIYAPRGREKYSNMTNIFNSKANLPTLCGNHENLPSLKH